MEFYDTLTICNIEEVAKKIEEKLTGKRFTFVASNEFFEFEPEVRTGQTLKKNNPVSFWVDKDNDSPKYAGFNVSDSYGVWGLSTSKANSGYDSEFNAPYVVIEHNKIKMTLRAPAGHKIYWVVAVETE